MKPQHTLGDPNKTLFLEQEKQETPRLLQMKITRCEDCPLSKPAGPGYRPLSRPLSDPPVRGYTTCKHPEHIGRTTFYAPLSDEQKATPPGELSKFCPLVHEPQMIPKPEIISFLIEFYVRNIAGIVNDKGLNIRKNIQDYMGFDNKLSEDVMDFAIDAFFGDVRKGWDAVAGLLKLEDLFQGLTKVVKAAENTESKGLITSYEDARIAVIKDLTVKLGNILEHKDEKD